jgi:hypothetical protein
MLSQNELNSLNQIISDDSKTFENIADNFQKNFTKLDQFKVGLSLWIMIKENLLNLSQRLASFYIIYDMYRQEECKTTPFIPLLLESFEKSTINVEKKLLKDLIEINSPSPKVTIREYIENGKNLENIEISETDMDQYWRFHDSIKDKCIQENNDWISPVLYDNSENENSNYNNDVTQNEKSQETMPVFDISKMSPEELNLDSFEPNFLTYYPNSNQQFYNEEPMWILPTLKYDFIWDFTMAPIQDTLSNLLNKAIKNKSLNEEQFNFIIETIEENPNILKEIGFKPDNLFELIEKNELLATEVLYKISNSMGFEDYLSLFIEKKWSINSLKVINKLIQKIEFPAQFITTYLKHIIKNFETEPKKDQKRRLARLISFFLLNLLDHEHITINMIPPSISLIFEEKQKDPDIQKLQEKINTFKN